MPTPDGSRWIEIRRGSGLSVVRQFVLATVVVVLCILLGALNPQPALAHDAFSPADATTQTDDSDTQNQAATLTEQIRQDLHSPTKLPAIRVAAADKAERRRALINQLAKTNPKAVLDLAFDPSERNAMPESVRNLVEARVNLNGELLVRHIDYEDGHSEYDARIVKQGKETPLRFGAPIQQAQPGDIVQLSGVALAGDPTVVSDQIVTAQSTIAAGPTGLQRTAIILVSAPGANAHPYADKTKTASIFFASANPQSAYNYYLQASYGQATIAGGSGAEGTAADVYGPYTLSTATCDTDTLMSQAFAAADSEINFNNYQRAVLSVNYSACGGGGVGTVRTQTVGTYDGATQKLSVAWVYNSGLGSTALNGKIGGVGLHEYGHNLGVWHANTLECGTVAIGSGACSSTEYGDPADVMGNSSGYGQMNGVHKDILTWLSGRTQTISTNGTYTLNAYEDSAVNTKVLKIARTRDNNGLISGYYYLEFRKPTSTWNGFLSGRPDYGNGVLVHTAGSTPLCSTFCGPDYSGAGGGGDSELIDTQPNTMAGTTDFNDAPLKAGESYTDTGAGVTIAVSAVDTTGGTATVNVTFGTPARSVRTVVYPADSGTVSGGGTFSVGQTVTLTASPTSCFIRWRENRASQAYPNPYTFTIAGDRELEATFATSCGPAPANDNFPGATITPSVQTATTTGATTQSAEPLSFACDAGTVPIGKTVWYSYTPTTNGALTFSTVGSGFDTIVRAYTGSDIASLTAVPNACDDDVSSGDTTSLISFAATAGTSYRFQVGGYDSDAGSLAATLSYQDGGTPPTPAPGPNPSPQPSPSPTPPTPTPTPPTPTVPDPRQEGAVQIGGPLTPNSIATFLVAIKNYGTGPTPAIHPYIDGTNNASQPWHADGSKPGSAVIAAGQTQTFILSVNLTSARIWTASTITLWDDDHGAVLKPLPDNGNNQQFSFTLVMGCSPRPLVDVKAAPSGDGRLAVTITAGATDYGNRLHSLRFVTDGRTPNTNALIDVPGIGSGIRADSAVPLPNTTTSFTFYLRRQAPGQPVTVPVEVTDDCGVWQTIVGGGAAAPF
jgi:hypothetical protein